MKKFNISILVTIAIFLFLATNVYAGFYTCIVTKVSPKPNGNVALVILPGATENKFTGEALATISITDPGAKNMYATVLTAVSLNKEVGLILPSTPSGTNQVIDGVSLILD